VDAVQLGRRLVLASTSSHTAATATASTAIPSTIPSTALVLISRYARQASKNS
jgi:hypothetical protein